MQNNYQEIADLVAKKCQEVLAPLYEELHELQAHYGMRDAQAQPTEPQPDPEEVRQAEFKKTTCRDERNANQVGAYSKG